MPINPGAFLLMLLLLLGLLPLPASALSVPAITIDHPQITFTDPASVTIGGTISSGRGQKIVLLDAAQSHILSETKAGTGGTSCVFSLHVPAQAANIPAGSSLKLFVKSLPASGLTASKPVPVTITRTGAATTPANPAAGSASKPAAKPAFTVVFRGNGASGGSMKAQRIETGRKVRLTKNSFSRTGYRFAGWSTEQGKVISMKHFQLGKAKYRDRAWVKNLAGAGKTVTLYACWKGNGAQAACDWAKRIAADNRFNYGRKPIASRHGCYYCGTNGNKVRKSGGDKRYYRTYVCMTFVNAAYVHGANESRMRCTYASNRCLDGLSRLSTNKKDLGHVFKSAGKPKMAKLKPGDVLLAYKHGKNHTSMYIGGGKIAEATSGHGAWSKKSISVHTLSSSSYRWYDAVIRYRGK